MPGPLSATVQTAPHGYDVYSAQTSTGGAYVLVQVDVTVNVETA
jgi:hypothetical protein